MALSSEQKFLFDLEGYLVLPGVLSAAECNALSALADEQWPRTEEDGAFRRTEQISLWGDLTRNLMTIRRCCPFSRS